MPFFLTISRLIDAFNARLGRTAAWALVLAILISTINASIRKLFNVSSNGWLESQWMLFGAVFLLCAPWTLQANEHIRIDIISAKLSRLSRHLIDVMGHLVFLIPFCVVMIITSWPFFTRSAPSWSDISTVLNHAPFIEWLPQILDLGEQSQNAGGLPQWPAKGLVFVGFVALFAQAISELIKRVAIMSGHLEDTSSGGGHHDAAQAEAQRLLDLAHAEKKATLSVTTPETTVRS